MVFLILKNMAITKKKIDEILTSVSDINNIVINFLTEHDCEDFIDYWKSDNYQMQIKTLITNIKIIKKHSTPYSLFCRDMRPALVTENPDLQASQITKMLSKNWSELKNADDEDSTEKYNYYVDLSNQEKVKLSKVKLSKVANTELTDSSLSDKIKKPKTAYMYFCDAYRDIIKDEEPGITGSEIMKILGVRWKELKGNTDDTEAQEELATYEQMAAEDKERYSKIPKSQLPKKVKRAKSAYNFFCNDYRKVVKEEYPDEDSKAITKMLGTMWKELKSDVSRYEEYQEYIMHSINDAEKIRNNLVDNETDKQNSKANTKPNTKSVTKNISNDSKKSNSKRGKTAYNIFCQHWRPIIKEEVPEMTAKEVSIKLNNMWKNVKEDEAKIEEYHKYLSLANKNKDGGSDDESNNSCSDNEETNQEKQLTNTNKPIITEKIIKKQLPVISKSVGHSTLKAYNNFKCKKMVELKEQDETLSNIEVIKKISILWKDMTEEEKAVYE